MSPAPIKSVGRIRQEPTVEPSRERNSEAYRMAVDGITSSAEYIAMIDAQVEAGQLQDDLAQEIRAEIGMVVGGQDKYTHAEFIGALAGAVADVESDEGFKSSFDFQKKGFDSIRDMAEKYRRDSQGKERKELSPKDKATFRSTMSQIMRDPTMSRDSMLVSEVDRAMTIIRRKALERLGITNMTTGVPLSAQDAGGLGQMIPGIEPLDISGDDEELDSPSDVHIDMEALEAKFKDLGSAPQGKPKHECKCGGHCSSRGG